MVKSLVLAASLAGAGPVSAYAQAALAGSVTDPSGAPVAGVSVEASSAALIEQRRTTVTDAAGRVRERERAAHVAGELTPQSERLLGRTGAVPQCTGATPGMSEPPRIAPEAVGVDYIRGTRD